MKDTENGNRVSGILVKNDIRKTPNDCPTKLEINLLMQFRQPFNRTESCVHTRKELVPQTCTTTLVPGKSLSQITFRFRGNY